MTLRQCRLLTRSQSTTCPAPSDRRMYADILHARTFVARRKCAHGQIFLGYPARTLSGQDKILHFRRVFTARASRRRRFRAIYDVVLRRNHLVRMLGHTHAISFAEITSSPISWNENGSYEGTRGYLYRRYPYDCCSLPLCERLP